MPYAILAELRANGAGQQLFGIVKDASPRLKAKAMIDAVESLNAAIWVDFGLPISIETYPFYSVEAQCICMGPVSGLYLKAIVEKMKGLQGLIL